MSLFSPYAELPDATFLARWDGTDATLAQLTGYVAGLSEAFPDHPALSVRADDGTLFIEWLDHRVPVPMAPIEISIPVAEGGWLSAIRPASLWRWDFRVLTGDQVGGHFRAAGPSEVSAWRPAGPALP